MKQLSLLALPMAEGDGMKDDSVRVDGGDGDSRAFEVEPYSTIYPQTGMFEVVEFPKSATDAMH